MNILNLPDWEIVSVDNQDMQTVVTAKYLPVPTTCPKCGVVGTGFVKNGTYSQKVADAPQHGKAAVIDVQRQRLRCRECGQVIGQPVPDIDERGTMTKRLVEFIERRCFEDTFSRIARDVGVTEGTVRNVFKRLLERLEGSFKVETPRVLGIDELHLLGKPRCILTNIEQSTIIDLLEDRKKDMVYRYLVNMPDRQWVEIVTIDMWQPYRDAVKAAMPGSAIVIDKFHILRMADKCLDDYRKSLRSSLSAKMGRTMMRSRFLLKKRPEKLKDDERISLEAWLNSFPLLKAAYEIKEGFYAIWHNATDSKNARALYETWKAGIITEMVPEFRELTTAVDNWSDEIFAYFDHRVTNAFTEAKNGLIKIANRNGRGYSFDILRARILYKDGPQKLKEQPSMVKEPFCAYCAQEPAGGEVEHFTPRETYGVDWPNFIWSCKADNSTTDEDSDEDTESTEDYE